MAEYALATCTALAAFGSNSLPPCMTGIGFSTVLLFWMWYQTIDTGLGLYFQGAGHSWKEIQYDCPITRWYYSNEWTHNFLFLCWHIFYVGFYLQAAGCTYLGLPILALTALPALARLRCLWVVGKVQFLNIYEVDVLKHELKSSQVRLEEQKQQT